MRVGKAKRLTHLDERGAARMVDVAAKASTVREALAECVVRMVPATLRAVKTGTAKGDALQVEALAATSTIRAAPRASRCVRRFAFPTRIRICGCRKLKPSPR